MERTYLQLTLVFCIMVFVSGFFFKDTVKIEAPEFGIVGEYVNITCQYSKPTDPKMEINNKLVNATKISSNIIWFRLTSDKKQQFRVACPPHIQRRVIQFGYKPGFNYSLERNIDRNILLFITSAIEDDDQYFRVTCERSNNESEWFLCNETEVNKTTYMFLTENWLYFKFNITSSNRYDVITESVAKLKQTIPIRFPRLSDISFTSLPSVDPFQQHGEIKLTHARIEMNTYNLIYEVKYWSEYDDQQLGKTLHNSTNIFTLEKLHPYTTYVVTARVKDDMNGLWNPPLTKKFMTDTAPSDPPKTTNGSYYLWNCTETGLGKCIVIYWEKVPRRLVNGKLKGYCVQIIDENNSINHCQDPKYLTYNSLYKEFKDLDPNKALTFSITAVNNDKRKPEATIMQVGKEVPEGPKAVYAIQMQENLYNVSWLLHPHQEMSNVTVFLCRNKDIITPHIYCMDNVKWERTADENYLLVNNSVKPLVFAAYISTKEGMSPLTKAECIFNPGKPTKPKQPEILASDSELTVLWPEFTCESLNGIPVAYEILYNKGQKCDNGSKKELKPIGIKPSESSSVIQSLESLTNYALCIRVVTEKYTSLMSDAVTVKTKDSSGENDDTPKIVGVLFGTLLGVILISCFIYCIIEYKKGKDAINIELPAENINSNSYSASNLSYCHEYTTIESKDTKENQNKPNGVSSSFSYMRAAPHSNSFSAMESDNSTSANTTTSLVSSEPTPLSSADDGESGNQEEHHEIQDKSALNGNFENLGKFNEIPANLDMKNPDNVLNYAASGVKGNVRASPGNVETNCAISLEQEAVKNLTKDHSDIFSENIELNNIVEYPDYVMVGDHCLSAQTSANNSNDMLLPGNDSDSLGYPINNDIPTRNTSDPSFPTLLQMPNESFEEESKDSKSYDNTGYVTADYTKAVEDSENKVTSEYVSNDNSFPVQQTPTDIPQEQNIPTIKRPNSIDHSNTNRSHDYVLVENLSSPYISNT